MQLKQWITGSGSTEKTPRVVVFGDSHTAALARGKEFPDRSELYKHIDIVRVRKSKGDKLVGDVELEQFCRSISRLDEQDFVFSAIGGNQYAVVSTVQHPVDFDFFSGPLDEEGTSDGIQLIPMRALTGFIESGVRSNDGPVLRAIRQATKARVFHLSPPPPKENNSFISQYFESRFAGEGIDKLGPSKPRLRLKCWNAQSASLQQLCKELDIEWVPPPAAAVTEDGFLAPKYYAKDATHANRRYGELVLMQITDIVEGRTDPAEPAP